MVTETVLLKVLLAVVRAVVFVLGAVCGYVFAIGTASFPGGGPRAVFYLQFFTLLTLAVAAPACWCLSYASAAGDRWTLGYLASWVLWFAVVYFAVLLF